MNEELELDWGPLAETWREQTVRASVQQRLAARVRSESRRMIVVAVVEIIILVVVAVVARPRWAGPPSVVQLISYLGMWSVSGAIVVFATLNRRGSWRADAETPAAYLALIERRARAKLRTARFVRVAAWAQGAAVVSYVSMDAAAGQMLRAILIALGAGVACVLWAALHERRARSDLADAEGARALMGL